MVAVHIVGFQSSSITFRHEYSSRPTLSAVPTKAQGQETRRRRQQLIRNQTTAALKKTIRHLGIAEEDIDKDRDLLRDRWEVDRGLQLQSVTDDLSLVNDCFLEAQRQLKSAAVRIEDRLL